MTTPAASAFLLLQAANEFRHRLSGELAAVHGLSVNDFLLMRQLAGVSGHALPRSELARRMHVSASTVTRMAAPMEKVGLLARRANARDARQALVVLTEAGQAKLGEAHDTFRKRAEGLLSDRWTDAEIGQLAALLGRLVSEDVGPPA